MGKQLSLRSWPVRASVRPAGAALLAVATLTVALPGHPTVAPLIRTSTAVALLAAVSLALWGPGHRSTRILVSVPVACVVSLLVTYCYQGPASNVAAQWILVESLALLVLAIPAVRHSKPVGAGIIAVALSATIALLPLRIALTIEPPAGKQETVGLCVLWGAAAAVAVGAACYLRSLDSRRRIAVAAERRAQRLRAARDLHDFAAHDVTGVMVLAQAAQALAKDSPERALALLPRIEIAGLHALESMDRTIRMFSDLDSERVAETADEGQRNSAKPPLGLADVPGLIDRFNATGTISARLQLTARALDGLPSAVSGLGYRVVLEGVTNVRRHAASASEVVVDVRCADFGSPSSETPDVLLPALRITVTDNGTGQVPGVAPVDREGGGTGLADLGRRVEARGGTLTAEPRTPAGWQLAAVLPLRRPQRQGSPGAR
ncbi:histidine kinase [Streptomyces sp. 549]|uniref:sensor histidine kinase n=1 Tax=Streptomyces sp. 549 TaxID=3049076 RepID=UPI0024C31282|nr:histidine kinase [Streptomyces sp. 549]MDK1476999.1 histidine kinase [Streptomyces sp. 549]